MRSLALVFAFALFGCSSDESDAGPQNPGSSTAPVPFDSAGCTAPSLAPGANPTLQIEHEGQTRSFILYVPQGIDPAKPNPMTVNWHGLTSNAGQQQAYAGNAIADERKTIVAYPEGLGNSFNGGVCCSNLGNPPHSADDVGFGKAIVAEVARQICVDKRRVYSTGMSNGGYMSEHNGCFAADFYAAVAPVSALGMARADCPASRPITIVSFNGTEDPLVSYAVSQQSMAGWVTRNGCSGDPERTPYGGSYCDTWKTCKAGVIVKACTITGMNHCWPGNPLVLPGFCASGGLSDMDANQIMYDVLQTMVLP
jgi:polyhydroxybutyrate depolymerase